MVSRFRARPSKSRRSPIWRQGKSTSSWELTGFAVEGRHGFRDRDCWLSTKNSGSAWPTRKRLKQLRKKVDVLTMVARRPSADIEHVARGHSRRRSSRNTSPRIDSRFKRSVVKFDHAGGRTPERFEASSLARRPGLPGSRRVESIFSIGAMVQRLASPEGASGRVGHGQMSRDALERAMLDFQSAC